MERKWETRAAVVICAAAGVAAALLGARLLFGVLLPFVLAWGLSLAVAPAANALAGKTRVPRKVWAVLLLVLTLGLLVAGISAGVARGIRELEELLAALLAEGDYAGSGESAERAESGEAFDWFGKITAGVGLFRRAEVGEKYEMFREEFNAMVGEMLSSLAGALSAKLPGVAGKLISAMPSAFLFVLVTVIAGFYFCVEPGQVGKFLTAHLPRRLAEKIPSLRARAKAVSLRYLRAYLLILFVTFVQLFIGFLILRVRYAFLLSLLVAVVDFLPVLGVGTVLVPWAIIALLRKNFYLGFGLLILFAAVTVLRQIIEPRLIGKSLGVHPLAALIAGYAGWRWFGFLGMALGPVAVLAVSAILRGRAETKEKEEKEKNSG